MENVIVVIFQDEKSTYQVLSDLKSRTGQSAVLQAGIIQNVGGSVVVKDGFTTEEEAGVSWASGGLIGGLVGILGGPVGMLLGASLGMLAGSMADADNALDDAGVVEQAAHSLKEGYLGLIVLADEESADELDGFFNQYGASSILRRDVASVQQEIYQAEETAEELKQQAKEKMRQQKKDEWKQKAQNVHNKIKQDFAKLRNR